MRKKKKRFNYIKFIVFLLIFYLIGYGIYYMFRVPTKNIIITGNRLVSDSEIIEKAGIKDYPSIFSISKKKVISKLKEFDLISDVKVKKSFKFELFIEVTETKVICEYDDSYYLGDGTSIDGVYLGIPVLINYVPEGTFKKFLSGMNELNYDIISSISEIKYVPDTNDDGEVIDEEIFEFKMNDGNIVYISISKLSIMDKYQKIYASIGDKKGILHLDKGNYLEVQ